MAANSPAVFDVSKLVRSLDASSESVEPTICFTAPACRSMHGLKRIPRRWCSAKYVPCGQRMAAGRGVRRTLLAGSALPLAVMGVGLLNKAPLDHKSAVAIVPPEPLWAPIQDLRERLRDGGLCRWPPHVNLVYPFVRADYHERCIPALSDALRSVEPFQLRLASLRTFGGPSRGVLWVDPVAPALACQHQDRKPVVELYTALARTLSLLRGVDAPARPFTPHMTVTHTRSRDEAVRLLAECRVEWAAACPGPFQVDEVYVLRRDGATDPFRKAWVLPLGEQGTGPRALSRREGTFASIPSAEDIPWKPRMRQALRDRARSRPRRGHETGLD